MPQQCAEPPPRPPPTGAKQGHNPPTTPPPQPDSPGKPPKPHPPNPTHPRGSSPHTRGAPLPPSVYRVVPGIIPAYAGSTVTSLTSLVMRRDHPRIRGEHITRAGRLRPPRGSSPHTRGAHRGMDGQTRGRRIIPAYAGSTFRFGTTFGVGEDHPRIRGEHAQMALKTTIRAGSSPHTRGAQPSRTPTGNKTRIIPAYAGSTAWQVPCRPGASNRNSPFAPPNWHRPRAASSECWRRLSVDAEPTPSRTC